ncbi:MAG: hypothetical protein ABL879_08040 [Devosia sp.]
MSFGLTGGRSLMLAAILVVSTGLSACTTTEGTSAFTSFQTFEDEVLNSTATGLGLIGKEEKPDPEGKRGPLVLPKDTATLPAPEDEEAVNAALPKDSNSVKIDTTGLTQADISAIRNARVVVDPTTLGGRPLTEAELRKLTVRMKAFRVQKERSIFLPPAEYYDTAPAAAQNLVCLAANGDLVAVNDPACPPEIQKALLKKG